MHVKYGILPMRLQELVEMCNMHIMGCEVVFFIVHIYIFNESRVMYVIYLYF